MLGLKPIKMLPARERVAAALRKAIISRQITEGEVLTLENTAQELGVSITPVREAFQILERDGLIDLKQNKGATVLGINETTLREHFQIRAALESEACALCCRNHIDMSRIEQVLTVSKEMIKKEDYLHTSLMPVQKSCSGLELQASYTLPVLLHLHRINLLQSSKVPLPLS